MTPRQLKQVRDDLKIKYWTTEDAAKQAWERFELTRDPQDEKDAELCEQDLIRIRRQVAEIELQIELAKLT